MTTFTSRGGKQLGLYVSDYVTIGTTIDFDSTSGTALDTELPHGFVGIELATESGGEYSPSTSTAGTVTITVGTVVNPGALEAFPNNVIDCSAPTTTSWEANLTRIRAVPSGIDGPATHWRLLVALND